MTFGWTEVIGAVTFLQLSLLAVVAFRYKKGRTLSNRLLAGFLTANALLIAQFLCEVVGWSMKNTPLIIAGMGSSTYFLLMPLLYLYIKSLCYKDFHLSWGHLLHALPFAAASAAFVVRMAVGGELALVEYWSHKILLHLQIPVYLGASLLLLIGYRKRLKVLYSSLESIDLAWCNLLLAGFVAMWLVDLLNWVLSSFHANPEPVRTGLIITSVLANLLLALAVAYRGLMQGGIFSGIVTPPKYAASSLAGGECGRILDRLLRVMEEEKPYLEPSLSIEDLARKLAVSPKHLSQTIHSRLNQSFYDFVNARRIEAAKDRFQSDAAKSRTVLDIAYEVGFNSKSVFNAAFKRHTGLTPKDFRRQSQQPLSASPAVPAG